MRKHIKSLVGVLEYDAWRIRWKEDRHCALRLTLFDLPISRLLLISTKEEVTPGRYSLYRVHYQRRCYAVRIYPWQRDYTFLTKLNAGGEFSFAVYSKKARPATDEPLHNATYRIDSRQKRPVREAYHKVALYVEDEWRENAPRRRREPTETFPEGSLFA